MFRSCTRLRLTVVVAIFTRYDFGSFDGLITLPVQCTSVMLTMVPGYWVSINVSCGVCQSFSSVSFCIVPLFFFEMFPVRYFGC